VEFPPELLAGAGDDVGVVVVVAVVLGPEGDEAGEALGAVRANAAFRLHEDGASPETVIDEVARFGLVAPERAKKSVEFLLDPTWRAYITCYVEGLPLCRRYVDGRPERFERLITEQCIPAELEG